MGDALSESGQRERIPRAALVLGYAGLLPVVAALLFSVQPLRARVEYSLFPAQAETSYAALILSFLGGMWWGQASRVQGAAWTYVAAVTPTLVIAAVSAALFVSPALEGATSTFCMSLVIGFAVLATLPVDVLLARRGIAPAWWLRLRVPLSLGLGLGTMLIGALAGG